ncbi:MAG TPA: methyltransferase domain-containing protein [Steroidobacteraceae bacterium]|nr:methyltransferase domain-containing protein [Steroidobacteraceae bacterium]
MSSAAHRRVLTLCAALLFASGAMAAPEADKQSKAGSAALEAAFASPDRPADDREQDARRHSREVLEFLGVTPGMHVIDVFSAGGYNTELLARAVGVKGEVIAYNNPPYARYAAKAIEKRYGTGRLGNVRQVTAEVDELELAPGSLDAALFVMSYHDVYFRPKDGGFDRTRGDELLARIHRALKPGGVVVVQDHVAKAGGNPIEVAEKLHRIDPALVRRDFEQAGFEFDGSSEVLKRPEDDHTKLVFDEAIRGKTDQFVYRFRKPVS